MAPLTEHDILCTSLPLNNVTGCNVIPWLDSNIILWRQFQPCSNGMTTGNNDIADTTVCSVTYLRQWLPCV